MPRAFTTIAFTKSVKAAQQLYGSREANQRFELGPDSGAELGPRELEFISGRDSFYQATVGDNDWPYVQHRGGPHGFLRVLDSKTLGYADFRGNVQYLSVGNLTGNNRISLILMDYANRRRLKIWGRVRIVNVSDEPALMEKLENPDYRAPMERGIIITVEAWDWNCPKHITKRFTDLEVNVLIEKLQEEITDLKSQLSQHQPSQISH